MGIILIYTTELRQLSCKISSNEYILPPTNPTSICWMKVLLSPLHLNEKHDFYTTEFFRCHQVYWFRSLLEVFPNFDYSGVDFYTLCTSLKCPCHLSYSGILKEKKKKDKLNVTWVNYNSFFVMFKYRNVVHSNLLINIIQNKKIRNYLIKIPSPKVDLYSIDRASWLSVNYFENHQADCL